jgi:hypothetical protein
MYDNVGQRLLAAAQGQLPASLGLAKHDRLVDDGVLRGDVTWLLKCVPKKVAMLPCEPSSGSRVRRASPATTTGPRMRNQ